MDLFQIKRELINIQPEIVFNIFNYPISNTTLLIFLIIVLILSFYFFNVRKFTLIPTKIQSFVEIIYEGIVSLIGQVTGNSKITNKILPLIGALFVYLGISNVVTLIVPGLSSITYDGISLFRTPTSDFNTTFGLAFGVVLLTNVVGIIDWGFFNHLGKFFQFKKVFTAFKKSPGNGGIALVEFFVGLLDIISEFAKMISLSLRLFGNMYAGEVLMLVIFGALAYLLPSVWFAMSLFVGLIQAMVFGLLVAAYYMLVIKPSKSKN